MSIKIHTDIPVPEQPRRGRPRKIPLGDMSVGSYCTVDSGVKSVRSCIRLFNRNHQPDWTFRLKVLNENKTRIWRIT